MSPRRGSNAGLSVPRGIYRTRHLRLRKSMISSGVVSTNLPSHLDVALKLLLFLNDKTAHF